MSRTRANTRIWEMGIGRGTRETFPFADHRTVAEAWNHRFPAYQRAWKITRPKPREKFKPTKGTEAFTNKSFA